MQITSYNYIEKYKSITKECPFNTDPSDVFYFSEQDHLNTNLLVKNCIEIDISAAFPTLCRYLFTDKHPFVQKIFSFENKIERNKFIAITLTHNKNIQGQIGENGLKILNSYCKIIILGYVYNNFINVNVIEYKKDGIIFTGNRNYNADIEFNSFIENTIGIKFHIDKVDTYLRFNKTSIFDYSDKDIIVKGQYKSSPLYLIHEILPIFIRKREFFDTKLLAKIKFIYSDYYFTILEKSKLYQDLKHYYKFENRFIQNNGSLSVELSRPKNVLIYFLYPILVLMKSDK